MTTTIKDQRLTYMDAVGAGTVVRGIELERCTIVGSSAVQWDDPNPSVVLRDIKATHCTLDNCTAIGTRFEDITIDHLSIKGRTLQLSGCVFSRVKISGRVGPVMAIPPMPALGEGKLKPNAHQAIIEAYETVDWALDISEAEFVDADFYYVPGDRVRRDPETQFLLHRDRVARMDSDLRLPDDAYLFLHRFDFTPFDSMVAVAPKHSRNFRSILEALRALRDAGIAE